MQKWCIVNRANACLVFMDGKSKIPIGEPGNPEAATSHMRKALATASIELEATDHDYHVGNLTPSVNLICDTPQEASDSF